MRVVSYAVVRSDEPLVFMADDEVTLQWVLGLHLVANTNPDDLSPGSVERIKTALLDEQWGEAVSIWMEQMGVVVDVYPSHQFYELEDVELGPEELQFKPLFRS